MQLIQAFILKEGISFTTNFSAVCDKQHKLGLVALEPQADIRLLKCLVVAYCDFPLRISLVNVTKSAVWRCGIGFNGTAQIHSTKPEFSLCAGSNPGCGVSEIYDDENL